MLLCLPLLLAAAPECRMPEARLPLPFASGEALSYTIAVVPHSAHALPEVTGFRAGSATLVVEGGRHALRFRGSGKVSTFVSKLVRLTSKITTTVDPATLAPLMLVASG